MSNALLLAESEPGTRGFLERHLTSDGFQVVDGEARPDLVLLGDSTALDEFMAKIDVVFNRLVVAMIVVGGLIGSSLIGIFAKNGPHLLGLHVISVLGFVASGTLGLWLLWGVVRSGRL